MVAGRDRATGCLTVLAVLAGTIAIITAVGYLVLGWQGVASAFIGLVVSLGVLVWYWATGRLRWPSN